MRLRLTRADDRLRAVPGDDDPRTRLIAHFLETDLVQSAYPRHLLDQAERVTREGERSSAYRVSGNAYAVSLGPNRTRIQALYPVQGAPRGVALSTPEFLRLIKRWLKRLEG